MYVLNLNPKKVLNPIGVRLNMLTLSQVQIDSKVVLGFL